MESDDDHNHNGINLEVDFCFWLQAQNARAKFKLAANDHVSRRVLSVGESRLRIAVVVLELS